MKARRSTRRAFIMCLNRVAALVVIENECSLTR